MLISYAGHGGWLGFVTFLSGEMISGSHFWNGLTRSRNRTEEVSYLQRVDVRDIIVRMKLKRLKKGNGTSVGWSDQPRMKFEAVKFEKLTYLLYVNLLYLFT